MAKSEQETLLCRICAKPQVYVLPIFGGFGQIFDLGNKMNKHLPIKVCENDILPLNICPDCVTNFVAFDEMYNGCVNAQKQLIEMIDIQTAPEFTLVKEENAWLTEDVKDVATAVYQQLTEAELSSDNFYYEFLDDEVETPSDPTHEDSELFHNKKGITSSTSSQVLPHMKSEPTDNCEFLDYEIEILDREPAPDDSGVFDTIEDITSSTYYQALLAEDVKTGITTTTTTTTTTRCKVNPPDCIPAEIENLLKEYDLPINSKKGLTANVNNKGEMLEIIECLRCRCMFLREDISEHSKYCSERNMSVTTAPKESITPKPSRGLGVNTKQLEKLLGVTPRKKCNVAKGDKTRGKKGEKRVVGKFRIVEEKYVCGMCNKELPNRNEFLAHRKRKCPFNHFQCHECGVSYKENAYYQHHLRMSHRKDKEEYTCDICNKIFMSIILLEQHILYHFAERTIPCIQCPKMFKRIDHLRRHEQNVHGRPVILAKNTKFVCVICTGQFTNESRLRIHQLKHEGVCSFVCEHCGKSFFSESSLRYHQSRTSCVGKVEGKTRKRAAYRRRKGVEKKLPCEYCQRSFHFPSALKLHVRSAHLKEKPYVCKLCSEAFRDSNSLRRHRHEVHIGFKYQCEVCSRRVATPSDLKMHLTSHTSEKPYACPSCQRFYKYKGDMQRHSKICSRRVDSSLLTCPITL